MSSSAPPLGAPAAAGRAAGRRRRGAREEAGQTARAAEPGTGTCGDDDERDRRVMDSFLSRETILIAPAVAEGAGRARGDSLSSRCTIA